MEYFTELGYFGLFIASFLAATILPLGSEAVLSALLLHNFNPMAVVIVATVGNVLGSLLNYGLGRWANPSLIQKTLRISPAQLKSAEQRFQKYGTPSLLFAWLPIIGDPLTLIAGIFRVRLAWFMLWVTTGKLARYLIVVFLTQEFIL